MSRLLKEFLGMGCMIILLLIFAISSGWATIIESMYGTDTAWHYIYGSDWFGILQLLIVINLSYNIYKYRLYKIKKLPAFIFHFSFIIIFIGSAITRYIGFEGSMHIRENSKSNTISTREIFIQFSTKNAENKEISKDIKKFISNNPSKNKFDINLEVDGKKATLSYKNFILNGALEWTHLKGGEPILELVFSDSKNKRDIVLKDKDVFAIGDLDIAFNTEPKQKNYIQIYSKDDKFYIKTNQDINYMQMSDMSSGVVEKNVETPFDKPRLYTIDGVNFATKFISNSAKKVVVKKPKNIQGNNALIADLSYNGETQEVFMFFGDYPRNFKVADKEFKLAWSPKIIELPFSLYLKDFEMERYPGSNSPSGYSSEVILKDGNFTKEYKIYMNNVLDYNGYRFFQSSYDLDEQGTILSVNNDPGKIPTYIGYFLLMVGMFLNFFNKNSRFLKLSKLIDESSQKNRGSNFMKHNENSSKKLVGILAIFTMISLLAPNLRASNVPYIDKEHAQNLKSLIVQGFDGRMEPFDTTARDIMHKIYKQENFQGLEPTQVMLSLMINPEFWRSAEFIKVSDEELKKILGMQKDRKYAKFSDFYAVDDNNKTYYKLNKMAEEISRKPPGNRTTFDKDVIKVDERLNIFYSAFMSEVFKFIPKQNDPNHKWYSPFGAINYFGGEEGKMVGLLLQNYFESVLSAQKNGDWTKANEALEMVKNYQKNVGKNVIPSESKVKFELIFNKVQIFERLMPIYLLSGFALLIFVFLRLIKPNLNLNLAFKSVYFVNILAFLIHTTGLTMRWYISGHAPWSNAYESLVYIAWALSLSGIIFSKTSAISLSLTSILAGITLFVAHLNSIDPQITNLQPVLNSYWLTIHVSVITASYGFLGLGSLLGFFTLILFILKKDKSDDEISKNITESTRINEMSLILGLCLLTVGNFLGGIWANESWGRYWGWDSKETWSLVTILIYAAVIHMRFIPKLNSQYYFAVASMFSYASVIMTYFGVNFYLSGMHSYAAGEKIPIPNVVWISALVMFLLSFLAFFKRKFAKNL
ncbi:hypothetical protein F1B92_05755 [Campylobacter sp. FMV-PI01]|uniref:Cytochrome C biogenesis protein n=1 Tax=Campylobacter portucalensis TaxID=2608384 RepID=A0A6L5WKA1_9BACT|nr:cytochrome c biogenesis protein CcsA [Campylobacter portucalensis]MSN96667.1 hypothetical protein [Campylobacter portucalensis]